MNICAVATRSAMGSSSVRPKIGPDAIPRPASVPDASLRWYAGLSPSTNLSWSCGRALINQRGGSLPPVNLGPYFGLSSTAGTAGRVAATARGARTAPPLPAFEFSQEAMDTLRALFPLLR